jgi:HEAT repeat protein
MAGPATSRAAAIEQLSHVPREQALPLLKRVLLNGDPATDRPAALQGLRDLALTQGDADQRIRDTVREVIYHGDDEKLATDAQETLDVIAESETK